VFTKVRKAAGQTDAKNIKPSSMKSEQNETCLFLERVMFAENNGDGASIRFVVIDQGYSRHASDAGMRFAKECGSS
jgi:hypothetical protein